MGKLEGKVAVITAATSGMALATAKLFVKEGAYVFITGRRKDKLGEAVNLIGKNVTGVQGDARTRSGKSRDEFGHLRLARPPSRRSHHFAEGAQRLVAASF